MAYVTNAEFNVLNKVWTEIRDTKGVLSWDTFLEYSDLMRKIADDKEKHNKKCWDNIKEKRKIDKNYGRPKKQKKQDNE